MLVPRGSRGEVSILVSHDDMALAGGIGSDLEGDASKVLRSVVPLLGELKVRTLDLILRGTVRVGEGVHDDAILRNGELMVGVVEIVTLGGLHLAQRVIAIRQAVSGGRGMAVLDDDCLDDITLGVGHAINDNRVVTKRRDGKLGTIEGSSIAQRRVQTALGITLIKLDSATYHVIIRVETVDGAILADSSVDFLGGIEVGVVCLRLTDGVVAVGKRIILSGGNAVLISGDGQRDFAGSELLAVHDDGVVVVIDDGEGDALKAYSALRSLPGLSVELLDLDSTALHGLGSSGHVVGGDRTKRGLLNLLEANKVLVQKVALGSLGLIDNDGATRNDDIVAGVMINAVARNKVAVIKVGKAVIVGADNPSTSRLYIGILDSVIAIIIEGVVVFDGELGSGKRCAALRQVALSVVCLLTIKLAKENRHRVVRRRVSNRNDCGLSTINSELLVGCLEIAFGSLRLL